MTKRKSKYHLKSPRRTDTILLTANCHAAPVLFLSWDKLPQAAKNEFTDNGSIPCEGGGVPGVWCEECRFGEVVYQEYEP